MGRHPLGDRACPCFHPVDLGLLSLGVMGNDSVKRMEKGVKDIVCVTEQYDGASFPVEVTGWAH